MSPVFTSLKEKSPLIPVIVPFVVPLTTTDAPMMVSPAASFTTPLQILLCCTTETFKVLTVSG